MRCFITALLFVLLIPAAGLAHKVNLFVFMDGDTVVTESGYSRSKRVHNGTIEVRDASGGDVFLYGKTNDNGEFSFPIPKAALKARKDLLIRVVAGMGHTATWKLPYTEYSGTITHPHTEPTPDSTVSKPANTAPAKKASTPARAVKPTPPNLVEVDRLVRRAVREETHKAFSHINRQIAGLYKKEGPGMVEIVGGIGWIIGLFGVAAYMKSRRK